MTTRHPRIEEVKAENRNAHKGMSREIEPKVAMEDEWLVRLEGKAAKNFQAGGTSDLDFDIAAWFALDQDDEIRSKCMTECWYG